MVGRPPPNPSLQVPTNSGLNGAIPIAWDSNWQFYTDLTKDQIAAFQAMSEWQTFVASHDAWAQSLVGGAPSLTVAAVQQLRRANVGAATITAPSK